MTDRTSNQRVWTLQDITQDPQDAIAEIERLRGEAEVADEQLAQLRGFAEAHKTCRGSDETSDIWRLSRESKLEFALRGLYWDQVDYLTLNKLGGMNNHWMRAAREALGMDIDDVRPSPEEPARELTLLDFGYAPGNYTFKCHDCGQEAVGDKRALRCETCAAQALRENRRGAVKAAVVTNECTHEFRPIDSSGQRVCIYCNVRQEKASAPAWDCACNELDCPYCANRNALNGSEEQT